MNDPQFVSLRDAFQLTGIGISTLRKLADTQAIRCYKTPSGQRKFHKPSLVELCQPVPPPTQLPVPPQRKNFLYARVSSKKQLDDLHRQVAFLQGGQPHYADYLALSDVGSGINFQRKGLLALLDACLQGTVGEVVIAHRDRLCRFGYELIEQLVKRAGGSITVLGSAHRHVTSEEELAADLLSIVHIYSCRQMGKRKYCRNRGDALHPCQDTIDSPAAEEGGCVDEHLEVCL